MPSDKEMMPPGMVPGGEPHTELVPANEMDLTEFSEQGGAQGILGRITKRMQAVVRHRKFGTEVTLAHITEENQHIVLVGREIEARASAEAKAAKASEIASEFYEAALGAIRTHKLPQRYAVIAMDKHGQPLELVPFLLSPPASTEIGKLSDSATERGALSQSMMLTQVFARQAHNATQSEVDRLERLLDKALARVEMLENKRFEQASVFEDLLSQRHKRELEEREAKSRIEMNERNFEVAWKAVGHMATLGAAKYGLPLPPGLFEWSKDSPSKAMTPPGAGQDSQQHRQGAQTAKHLMRLFTSLSAVQQDTIKGCLSEEQGGMLKDAAMAAQAELMAEHMAASAAAVVEEKKS